MANLFAVSFVGKSHYLPHYGGRGFTLVEVLSVTVIVAILAVMAVPAWKEARERMHAAECVTTLKTIGMGIRLYAQDHNDELPRSLHSAGTHHEPGWAASISPYFGASSTSSLTEWKAILNHFFRCPSDSSNDPTIYSYGLNVFYELTPDGDDYEGSPATWRRFLQIPHPSKTILLAETRPIPFGDHFMCHQWSGTTAARNAVSFDRHSKKSNFLFADCHVDTLLIETTFNPLQGIDLWNPSKAR